MPGDLHRRPQSVTVHPDARTLSEHVTEEVLQAVRRALQERGTASLVLTGGGAGTATLEALAARAGELDWSAVHLWWGDERWLPSGDPDRNEVQAPRWGVPPQNVHPWPTRPAVAADGGQDAPTTLLDRAAEHYARDLGRRAGEDPGPDPRLPVFDVVLLGMGPDGHVASLFPGSAARHAAGRTTVGVPDSPKPPPQRLSLTLEALNTARVVLMLVSGEEKAAAVAEVLDQRRRLASGHPGEVLPAAEVWGEHRTHWHLDEASGSRRVC